VSENVEIRIDNRREWRQPKRHYSERLLVGRSLRILRRSVHARRATLDRDRCDTGSLVFVNQSDAVASYLAHESIENFQHEENRSAANAREYNRSDHIKLSTTFGRRMAFHKSNTGRGFSSPNERQSLGVALTKKVPLCVSYLSFFCAGRLRAAGDRGSEKYSLPTARFDSVVSRSHPRTPPAGWAGADFLAAEQNSITFPSFG
jgi:hypothetical protein